MRITAEYDTLEEMETLHQIDLDMMRKNIKMEIIPSEKMLKIIHDNQEKRQETLIKIWRIGHGKIPNQG